MRLPRLGQLDAGMGSLFGSRGPAAACPTPLAISGDALCIISIFNVLQYVTVLVQPCRRNHVPDSMTFYEFHWISVIFLDM